MLHWECGRGCDSSTPDIARGDDENDDHGDAMVIDFEDGSLAGWVPSFECEKYGISGQGYNELFPNGREASYLYVSSGGNGIGGCSMGITIDVPSGSKKLEVKYNFVSPFVKEIRHA